MNSYKRIPAVLIHFVFGVFPFAVWAATLEGNVRIENEIPLTGVNVKATRADGSASKATKSDSMGRFTFGGLTEGEWVLDFSSPPPIQAKDGSSGQVTRKTVHIRTDTSNTLINVKVSNFSLVRIDLKKLNAPLVGEVFLDRKKHGKTGENLLVQVGLHELMAMATGCASEPILMEFSPWDEPVSIPLECKTAR